VRWEYRSWRPRFKRARGRRDNLLDLKDIIEKWLKGFATRDEALAELDKERVSCALVLTVNEAVNHPHLNERKTVKWIEDRLLGKVAVPSVPVKFSSWPDRTDVRIARRGEDNERVLHELLGMTEDQIKGLYAKGILVHDPTLETHPSRA
jgi:CoA:oxalate CoA-transferase